jgi:hypothetical protein
MLSDEEAMKKFRNMKLVVATPEKLMWGTSVSMVWSMAVSIMMKPDVVQFKSDAACPLSVCRNRLLRSFYDSDFDWILFLDDDTVPPYDAIYEMIKYSDEYDILSGLYFRKSKRKGHKPVAFYNLHKDDKGRPYWNSLVSWPRGSCEVAAVGMGCCLIPKYAVKQMIENEGHPLFHYAQDYTDGWLIDGEDDYYSVGEDLYFCKKAVDSGLKIGLVTTVKCEHTGPHASIKEDDFRKAFSEGSLIGQSKDLPIVSVEQKRMLNDVSKYFHLDRDTTISSISFGTPRLVQDAKKLDLSTQESRNKFYLDNRNVLYHQLSWYYFHRDTEMLRNQLSLVSSGSVLHYGGGCGDVAIRCAELNEASDITYCERPGVSSDFAKWRMRQMHLDDKVTFLDLDDERDSLVQDKKYDTIICLDFLEYCEDPLQHLKYLKKHSHEKTRFLLGISMQETDFNKALFLKPKQSLRQMFVDVGIPTDIIQPYEPSKHPGVQDEHFKPIKEM